MDAYYTYFIATLPTLLFGNKAPFSFENFIALSARYLPEKDLDLLKVIPSLEVSFYEGRQQTLMRWQDFDTRLRNELAKIRASRKHIDPLTYCRRYTHTDTYLAHNVAHIHRIPSPLEAERLIDQERWRFLDELASVHYFDIDALIVYGLKLHILERWDKIYTADKSAMLEEILTKSA